MCHSVALFTHAAGITARVGEEQTPARSQAMRHPSPAGNQNGRGQVTPLGDLQCGTEAEVLAI